MIFPAALGLLLAYLIGAIPTGLLIGKWVGGIDLRQHGSKNIGFTNAMRVLGWKAALPVLVIDIGKAWGATLFIPSMFATEPLPYYFVTVGLAVLVGNLLNVFLGFRGGKGVATGLGVFLALAPIATGIALATFLAVFGVSKYVSLGSICAAVALAVSSLLIHGLGGVAAVALVAAASVLIKHRANIARLRAGTENRVGSRKQQPASTGD